MEPKDALEKLKKACAEEPESVHLANEAPEIATDGHTKMFAEKVDGMNAVSVGLADGGGFSSMLLAKHQWTTIRARLDALFDLLD